MRIVTPTLAGLVLLGLLSSCHDDDAPVSIVAAKLTGKHWNGLYKAEVMLTGKTDKIMWLEPAACREDDLVIYSKDGTYGGDVGADDCNGSEASSTGTWALKDEDRIITLTGDKSTVGPIDYEISFPDENTFVLTDITKTCCFDTDGDQIGDAEARWFTPSK